jgi:hypothetical protein
MPHRHQTGLQVASGQRSIAHNQALALVVALACVLFNVLLDFELQGNLEHLLGSFTGDLFEFAAADDARGHGFYFGCVPFLAGIHGFWPGSDLGFPDSYPLPSTDSVVGARYFKLLWIGARRGVRIGGVVTAEFSLVVECYPKQLLPPDFLHFAAWRRA